MAPARPVRAAIVALLLAAACGRAPKVAPLPPPALPADAVPAVTLEGATVTAGFVVVTYRLTDRGAPITGTSATNLMPSWTLAWLGTEPVSGLPAWESLLLTGAQTVASLPPGGPGTPAGQVLPNVRQPGAETVGTPTAGTTVELGDGRFTYTYANALPGAFDLNATLRVGVALTGTPGTATTCATFDFAPNGGPTESYATVLDANCNVCHGRLSAHDGTWTGTKACVTCHTWLAADPDTIDPAAMAPSTRATNPNPLELGRLVHRIHRGSNLPTLYLSSTCFAPAPALPPIAPALCNVSTLPPTLPPAIVPLATLPALPFRPGRNVLAPLGSKFDVVTFLDRDRIFGAVQSRIDNNQPARTVVAGVGFPRDLRDCDACHANAPEAGATITSISRRTCGGCHPDAWFGPVAVPTDLDPVHMPHSGGPQADDSRCGACHFSGTQPPLPIAPEKRYAPLSELHLAPYKSPRGKQLTFQLVDVQGLTPPPSPLPSPVPTATIRFKVSDAIGTVTPLNAPAPANDDDPTWPSPVPRAVSSLSFKISGPNTDYVTNGGTVISVGTTPSVLTAAADGSGVFSYTFNNPLPSNASGFWTVSIEGRRRTTVSAANAYLWYDAANDKFLWPYTGEAITEVGDNKMVSVDLATGTITTDPTKARRQVVARARCERCHGKLALHGGVRNDPMVCVLCHAPDATDWAKRPRDTRTVVDGGVVGDGMVLLTTPIPGAAAGKAWSFATLDGLEERSINLKFFLHRIHTGTRVGVASLEGMRPALIHTSPSATLDFDEIMFPNDVGNCELCHLPGTWAIESIPATASGTTANETGTLRHVGTSASPATFVHPPGDPVVPPITGACGCHTSGVAAGHEATYTVSGVEQCGICHGENGAQAVRRVHAIP